ncbi:MAG: hypothetical protein V3S55_09545 [Nitrospiraceae bacterium]
MPTTEERMKPNQQANIDAGHSLEKPFDFGGIDEPGVGEPDSGMGRFSSLAEDPEVTAGSETDLEGDADATVTGEAAPEPSAELQEAAERALDYNIPASDLEGMTVKQVNRFLDHFDTHVDSISAAAPAPAPSKPAPAATPTPATVVPATPAPELKLSDDADPDMVAMAKYLTSTVGPMAKEISELKAANASHATDTITQGVEMQFDVLTQKHGKAALNLFGGDGKMRPAQRVNRENIHKAVSVLVQGHKGMGGAMPAATELFDTALKSTLGARYANLAAGKKQAAIEQRQTQHIQRPHSRTTAKPATGYKKAVASVAAYMREHGMTDEQVATSNEEEFAPLSQ